MSDPGILLACDTLPENPWARDRLPAIRSALAGRRHEIMDIYAFDSPEEAHHLHRTKAQGAFPDSRVGELNRRFSDRVLASGCRIVVLGTVDNYAQFLLPATIRVLQEKGCFMVGILGDDEFTFANNWPYAFLFDRVVAYVKAMVDRYNALRPGCCLYLPASCHFAEPDFDRLQVAEESKKHDVALFGSVFPARLRLVESLVAAGVPLSLFGGKGWLESPRLRPSYRGYVASEDFDRTLRESRVVLALLEDHLTGAVHMNTKIWEAVRNGQFCVATRHPTLSRDYGLVENEDIVFYDTADELATKILHYLSRPDERRRIARNLFNKIRDRFDYTVLYRRLFDELIAAEAAPRMASMVGDVPYVTLLGNPAAEDEMAGFPVWRFDRRIGWRRRVAMEFGNRVTTPYVILAGGAFRYDPVLSTWLVQASPQVGPGVWRLRSAGPDALGEDTLLWESSVFAATVLSGNGWQRFRALAAPGLFTSTRPVTRIRPSTWSDRLTSGVIRFCRWIRRGGVTWGLAKSGPGVVG